MQDFGVSEEFKENLTLNGPFCANCAVGNPAKVKGAVNFSIRTEESIHGKGHSGKCFFLAGFRHSLK